MSSDALKLAEALAASTPGVWIFSDRGGPYVQTADSIRWLGDAMTVEDGRFFVEAHNRLPNVITEIESLRAERGDLLADADASQHWRTRALRAEEALEEARADAEGKAARLDVMETERNAAKDERDDLAEQIAAIGTWIDARTDAPRTDDSGQPLTLVQRLNATRAEFVRVREERDAERDRHEAARVRLEAVQGALRDAAGSAPAITDPPNVWRLAIGVAVAPGRELERLAAERDEWKETARVAKEAYANEYATSLARGLGKSAPADGIAMDACPFPPDSANAEAWHAGWTEAAAAAERDAARDLVSRAITNAGRHASRPLWSHIMHLFAVGSTRAHALCAEHGYDPDQEVGPSKRPQRKA